MPEADPLRRIRLQKSCYSSTTLPLRLASSRRGLVDLLVTGGLVRGADRDGGADLFELKLVGGGAILENVGHVLGVAGVANPLDARTLGRVITTARDLERLIELAALAFLLFLLRNLRDDRNGGQGEHRQKRRQQHQLLHLLPPLTLYTTEHPPRGLLLPRSWPAFMVGMMLHKAQYSQPGATFLPPI